MLTTQPAFPSRLLPSLDLAGDKLSPAFSEFLLSGVDVLASVASVRQVCKPCGAADRRRLAARFGVDSSNIRCAQLFYPYERINLAWRFQPRLDSLWLRPCTKFSYLSLILHSDTTFNTHLSPKDDKHFWLAAVRFPVARHERGIYRILLFCSPDGVTLRLG